MDFKTALDFIALCDAEPDMDRLVTAFRAAIRELGFICSACGSWAGVGADRVYRFYFNDWPTDWMEIYWREIPFGENPAINEARRSMSPFLLTELREFGALSPAARKIIALSDEYGWRQLLCVPIHGPASFCGLVSMSSKVNITLSPAARAALEMMALAVHRRCRATPGFGVGPPAAPALTKRQTDCLSWVAAGKSDADIATLLEIAEATVHFHIEAAKKRLGVRSRVQAVALLVLTGTL